MSSAEVRRQKTGDRISLRALAPEDLPLLWGWTHEYPERMVDDFWPGTLEEFTEEMTGRAASEQAWIVEETHAPVGFIGYARITPHLGSLRGVCFARRAHGTGAAVRALRTVLQAEFDAGVYKIMAFPFADNARAIAFYKKLGAREQGTDEAHTMRNGKLTDITRLAFFAPQDGYRN